MTTESGGRENSINKEYYRTNGFLFQMAMVYDPSSTELVLKQPDEHYYCRIGCAYRLRPMILAKIQDFVQRLECTVADVQNDFLCSLPLFWLSTCIKIWFNTLTQPFLLLFYFGFCLYIYSSSFFFFFSYNVSGIYLAE